MKPRWFAPALVAAATLAFPPAYGGSASGICTGNLRFTFNNPISNNAPPTGFSMEGSGNCQTSAQIAASKNMTIQGTGVATLAHCVPLVTQGSYVITFFPEPSPLPSNGQMVFVGTASGGAAQLDGSNPTFLGVMVLAGNGLVSCSGGTNVLNFTTSLTFVDP